MPVVPDRIDLVRDRFREVRFDGKAVARIGDRRLGDGGKRQRAKPSQRGKQTGDLARDGNCESAVEAEVRHHLAVAYEHVAPRRCRRGFAIVERVHGARRVLKMSMKPPPPIPHDVGLTTPAASDVATAASTALPPCCRMRIPASDANRCSAATIPSRPLAPCAAPATLSASNKTDSRARMIDRDFYLGCAPKWRTLLWSCPTVSEAKHPSR